MASLFAQMKAAEGRDRMRLARTAHRRRASVTRLNRAISMIGDGSRWKLQNLTSVIAAMAVGRRGSHGVRLSSSGLSARAHRHG